MPTRYRSRASSARYRRTEPHAADAILTGGTWRPSRLGGRMHVTEKMLALLAATMLAGTAQAETLRFHATLDGKAATSATGSAATGTAKVRVDSVTHKVSVDLDIHGLTMDALWDRLVKGPIG